MPAYPIVRYMPELEADEAMYLARITEDYSDEELEEFAFRYRQKRVDAMTILLTNLIGTFIGIGGIHRFILGQIGMGILYLLTGGLCLIGAIIDAVNYKQITNEYNQRIAYEVSMLIR